MENSNELVTAPPVHDASRPSSFSQFNGKEGTFSVDSEIQTTGKAEGALRGIVMCPEGAVTFGQWGEEEGKTKFIFSDPITPIREGGFDTLPYPLPEGHKPYVQVPILFPGVGLSLFNGNSWSTFAAVKKIDAAFTSMGCSHLPVVWIDIIQSIKSAHKNYSLFFRTLQWLPIEQFVRFSPHAASMKEVYASPAIAALPTTRLPTGDIINDELPFQSKNGPGGVCAPSRPN